MKLRHPHNDAGRINLRQGRGGRLAVLPCAAEQRAQAGFNMVEIAICLAIIGIALVAIIGVMPTGTRATQDNREETIIDQDGRFFLQAIRTGAEGVGDIPGFVDSIDGAAGPFTPREVIGKLSARGRKVAVMRSLTGPAAERASKPVAFRYLLTVDVESFQGPATPYQGQLTNYLYDVRLRFEWPLRPDGTPGNQPGTGSPRVFRTLVSGWLEETNGLAFFRP
jgi:prepilin-type N-terminal cleavage/methylation domain-containing protein